MKRLVSNKKFNIIYNVLRFIYCFILVFYLLFIVVENVSYNTSIFGYRVFVVVEDSSDMIYSNDGVILIKDIGNKALRNSDEIVVSETDNGLKGLLVVRKIVDVQNDGNKVQYFVNDKSNDKKSIIIDSSSVVGKVVNKLTIISFIDNIFQNQLFFFLFVFIPIVLIIVIEILKTINSIEVEHNSTVEDFKRIYYCRRKVKNFEKSKNVDIVVEEFYDEEII